MPIVRGFIIPERVIWKDVPEVVGTLVKVTCVDVTVQGEGEHDPTLLW